MKPKKRYQQTQSGRLFLRKRDHRDIVLDDKYHNGMYFEDEEGKHIWVRYPRRACVVCLDAQKKALLDVDRRCIHYLLNTSGLRFNCIIPLENFLVYYDYYGYEPIVRISEDGQIWKTTQGISSIINSHTFDRESSFVYGLQNTTDAEGRWTVLNVTRIAYTKDDEGNWNVTTRSNTFKYRRGIDGQYVAKPIGSTHDGLIVIHDNVQGQEMPIPQHEVGVYKIDADLNQTLLGTFYASNILYSSLNVKYETNSQGITFCQKGSFMAIAVVGPFYIRQYGDYVYYKDKVILYGSSDNGATWTGQEIYDTPEHNQWQGWSGQEKWFRLIYRKTKFFFYFYDNTQTNCQCWASEYGHDWYQLNMPEYVDVPIEQNPSGYNTAQTPTHQTVRLKVATNAPSGSDANAVFRSSFSYPNQQYNDLTSIVDFTNGEQTNVSNKDEHLCFVADGYLFYFDNMILVCNENCYAIQLGTTTDEQSFEHLMEGDYCYQGTTINEGEQI